MRPLLLSLLASSALAEAPALYFDGPEVVKLDWNTTSPRSGDFDGDESRSLLGHWGSSGGGATAAAAASSSRLSHCADDDDGDECACAEPSELVIDERRAVAGDKVISDQWLVTQDCQSLSHSHPTIWWSQSSGQSQDATLPPCCQSTFRENQTETDL
jgi:hypothetical protein